MPAFYEELSKKFNFFFTPKDFLQQRQDEAEETEAEELRKRELEINEMQDKKAVAIEKECESIESECTVLQVCILIFKGRLFKSFMTKFFISIYI